MNIPRIHPPSKRNHGTGPQPSMTPMQEIEAWSWFCAKRHLGTFKTKAAEMGITESALINYVRKAQNRERDAVPGFYEQLKPLPF